MRSVLLIIITIVLLVGGLVLYIASQPQTKSIERATISGTANIGSTTRPQGSAFGAGEGAWANTYDQNTGLLASRFRAKQYEPRSDGTVHVVQLEAEFFDTRGRIQFTLKGDDGDVVMPGGADQIDPRTRRMGGGNAAAVLPNRGQLRGVRIDIFPDGETSTPLVLTLNNAAFDNDTFRIYTESFVNSEGIRVPGDRVPVQLRGPDYDFDGTGLTVRWNERERILQALEIAHGERVLIRNTQAISLDNLNGPRATTAPAPAAQVAPPSVPVIPVLVTPHGTGGVQPAAVLITPPGVAAPARNPIYRATFFDDVRIIQADQNLATGDTLTIDFLVQNDDAPHTAPAPVELSNGTPTPVAPIASLPTIDQATTQPTVATTLSPSNPAPARAEPPIEVRWAGKLRIDPVDRSVAPTVEPGEALMTLVGQPVKVDRDGTSVRAASLTYSTRDAGVRLLPSATIPVTVTDARGTRVNAKSVEVFTDRGTATVFGPADAIFVIDDSAGATTRPTLSARWVDRCDVTFSRALGSEGASLGSEGASDGGAGAGNFTVRSAELRGKVEVDHPQLDLRADGLLLAFDEPDASAPNTDSRPSQNIDLKTLTATGNVIANLPDDQGVMQTVKTDRLTVATSRDDANRSYPSEITAVGAVDATDGRQSIRAGSLVVTLQPAPSSTTQPAGRSPVESARLSVELDRMVAKDSVHVTGRDGAEAKGAELIVARVADQTQVTLRGSPASPATVTDGATVLTGPVIEIDPTTQTARVGGAGTLRLSREQKQVDGAPPRPSTPVNVAWSRGVVVDGAANVVTVEGDVNIVSTDPDGTENGATARTLKLKLADAPVSRADAPVARSDVPGARADAPVARVDAPGLRVDAPIARGDAPGLRVDDNAVAPQARAVSTTRPAVSTSGPVTIAGMDFLRGKVAREVMLEKDVEVRSVLLAPSGEVLRRVNLLSDVVRYDLPGRQFEVPAPGRMLFEDRRPPDAKATAGNAAVPALANRGATAFQWTERLVYDEPKGAATMSGGVIIVHQPPPGQQGETWRLDASRVTAFVEPQPEIASQEPGAADVSQTLRLKKVLAEGDLTFTARDVQFEAAVVEFNPQTNVMTARGTSRTPATLAQGPGYNRGNFDSLEFNVSTNQLKVTGFRATVRR